MKIMKRCLLVAVIIILANIPYVGYFPQVFKNECTYPIMNGNCGYPSIFALLNPIFWLPTFVINYSVSGNPFYRIHLYYELSNTHNYAPLQFYIQELDPLSSVINLIFLFPYWVILSILLKKVYMGLIRRKKAIYNRVGRNC